MNFDIGKVLDTSARASFAICFASIFLLFFPATFLPFDIIAFREKYGIWFFIIFAISASLLISYIMKYIIGFTKRKWNKINTWRTYKYILKNLSDVEKVYLKQFYDKGQTAILFSMMDPVAQKLKTFGIISLPSVTSIAPRGLSPGFIQPWVFELLHKHPDYLNVSKATTQEVQKDA